FLCAALAQSLPEKPITSEPIPDWAELMYQPDPNVWAVDIAYDAYYREHPFEKTAHTQYYKHWRRVIDEYIDDRGFVRMPDLEEERRDRQQYLEKIRAAHLERGRRTAPIPASAATWESLGPFEVFSTGTGQTRVSWQTNVYSIDPSISNPDVVYCGTEGA